MADERQKTPPKGVYAVCMLIISQVAFKNSKKVFLAMCIFSQLPLCSPLCCFYRNSDRVPAPFYAPHRSVSPSLSLYESSFALPPLYPERAVKFNCTHKYLAKLLLCARSACCPLYCKPACGATAADINCGVRANMRELASVRK